MPRFDGTGPTGLGSKTGRGTGLCTGYNVSSYENAGRFNGLSEIGRGGYGRSRGRRGCYGTVGLRRFRASKNYPIYEGNTYSNGIELSATEEMEILKNHANALKQQLTEIENKINTLEKDETTEEEQ